MPPQIIDGEGWIADRLQFLRERLSQADVAPEERSALEAEIDTLAKESGIGPAGWRFPRRLGFLRRKR